LRGVNDFDVWHGARSPWGRIHPRWFFPNRPDPTIGSIQAL
jgi:hypothetical protein